MGQALRAGALAPGCAAQLARSPGVLGRWLFDTSYRTSLDSETWLLLSTDSEFLKFLKGSER